MIPLLASMVPAPPTPVEPLVLHEWGTFTAVAGEDGRATTWRPLLAPSDLPGFVYDARDVADGLRNTEPPTKGRPALVRMETPVIYLYGPDGTQVHVAVGFPDGAFTEWYPRARDVTPNRIDWGYVSLAGPVGDDALPRDEGESHYYPARVVDADGLRVCDGRGDQLERFLFYRGVGDFELGLSVRLEGDELRLDPGRPGQGTVLVYERRGDAVGFEVAPGKGKVARPVLDDAPADVALAIRDLLVGEGLYPKEADAMLATWDGDWFEDGLRVLYVLPRAEVEARLPLSVNPAPDEVVRVIVGRIEVPTPEQEAALVAILDRDTPVDVLLDELVTTDGRFAEPLLRRSEHPRAPAVLAAMEARLATTR